MTEDNKAAKDRQKPITDVDKPADSVPAVTSKPVIVTNRPILKDPMVVEEAAQPANDDKKTDEKTELAHSTAPVLRPLDKSAPEPEQPDEPAETSKPETPAPEPAAEESEPEPAPEPTPKTDDKPTTAKTPGPTKQKSDAETAEEAKHEAAIQHLIDSKKYELPINAIEKRKSKRFVALGIIVAVLLVLAWGDTAADAGIIHFGIKPATHFFSN